MPVTTNALKAAFHRFAPNYAASLPDDDATARTMAVWAEQLAGQPWVTDAVFTRARNLLIVNHPDKYLPPFAAVLDYCHTAKGQLEREQERAEAAQRMQLAAPVGPDVDGEARVAAAKEQARAYLRARQKRPGW